MEGQQSTSGTQVEVNPFTELDIATMVVFLKARADRFGKAGIPFEVLLSPLSPDEGWRRAAMRELHANAKAVQRGERIDMAANVREEGGLMETAYDRSQN